MCVVCFSLMRLKLIRFEGEQKCFTSKNESLCPVSCMKTYLEKFKQEPFNNSAPLFVNSNIL